MTGEMQGEELSDGAVFRNAVLDQGLIPREPCKLVLEGLRAIIGTSLTTVA